MKHQLKHLLLLLVATWYSHACMADEPPIEFYITIANPGYVPTVTTIDDHVVLDFTDGDLDEICATYDIFMFQQAFPNSVEHSDVYYVKASSINLKDNLEGFDSDIFKDGHEARYTKFYINISDYHYIPIVSDEFGFVNLTFDDGALTSLCYNYQIKSFTQGFPASNYEHLRQMYLVEANSDDLSLDLTAYDASIFPGGWPFAEGIPQLTPNDYGYVYSNQQEELDLIKAKQAWDTTTGDVTVKLGLTDTPVDTTHSDLSGKIAKKFSSDVGTLHGTAVAGIIAANTNNTAGLSSIGYNLKVAISKDMNDAGMLTMSSDSVNYAKNVRVINASWRYNPLTVPCHDSGQYNEYAFGPLQDIYNNIYENGTVAVFSAGNGDLPGQGSTLSLCGQRGYEFPASWDHNISVTAIGHLNSVSSTQGTPSIIDEHPYLKPGSFTPIITATHNDRVDISAPGYHCKILKNGNAYDNMGTGTSFGAPLVTGTLGLMLSVKPCLSPWQLEYLLKMSADTVIYDTTINHKNVPYTFPKKRLGFGRLDAFKAVKMAKAFDCNNPAFQPLIISKVAVSHVCAPGFNTVNANDYPQIFLTLENAGLGPITYRWLQVGNNSCTINSLAAAAPIITGSSAPHIFYYVVIVTDNSGPVAKVASKRVKIQLKTSGYDLAMRDSPFDMYNEPNEQHIVDTRDWNIWLAPDVWNRQVDDNITAHENAEWFTTDSNYLYVRVANVGCANSPSSNARVRAYWTVASTGEQWKDDWDGTTMIGLLPGGGEITDGSPMTIPVLAPGATSILKHGWRPPKPEDYTGGATQLASCVLARIETTNSSPWGMTYAETINAVVTQNVRNNNNIITRNLQIVNLNSGNKRAKTRFYVANSQEEEQLFSFQVVSDRVINPSYGGNLSEILSAEIYLGDLYDLWVAGGSLGNPIGVDGENKIIYYDPSQPLFLNNITLEGRAMIPIDFELVLNDEAIVPYDLPGNMIHFRQVALSEREGSEELDEDMYGDVSFSVTIAATEGYRIHNSGQNEALSQNTYKIYPNPISDVLYIEPLLNEVTTADIQISDVTGRIVFSKSSVVFDYLRHEINTSVLQPGLYFIKLTDNKGHLMSMKLIKP